MSSFRARLRVPATAAPGETVTIRTVATHPMQSGLMPGPDGDTPPRNLVERFHCSFNGRTVIEVDLGTGVSADPYLEFDAVVHESGEFVFTWVETDGSRHSETAAITVG